MPIISGATVSGCDTAINCEGASVAVRNLHVEDGNHGIVLDDGAYADVADSVLTNHRGSGIRVRESGFHLENVTMENNEVGLDLNRGAWGDIIESEITDNWDSDIQLHREVLVRIFDTAAKEILDRTRGDGLEEVDAGWISGRILATDDVEMKARAAEKLIARVLPKVGIPSGTIQAAWDLARSVSE
jgi:hypothetical protein